ncbi:MAG: inosine/xanthosine triphosphatase [Candidatus Pacebacteria bacterium CG10_big_fil_rev_8_21_14_0_10_36_11]|nr:DUF84 family protein [Candidatus Pacearchaeota archaeon]OIP73741.1 MAG: hypothetical protein AUK08_04240 [Candidatus Pacebacteria bacterium CG2_30_36_39]PIR64673.1 MAG: inosine/xanthosine triphosphatase [Candidatus Pacebacteria bacterium CG10_big_fil_rev_8_21_14_0_10_36_11]PJC42742.1 MAG: inosine/xanthosine triphosphatase [Candidatus Pacebacteria bacterium CG_4_9_14_0_2_um_filter_36_8]
MKIFVGSANPVKVNAVLAAAIETWPDVIVKGLEVKSGVGAQPMSDEETKQGAFNRAKEALKTGLIEISDSSAIGVGMEGGVVDYGNEMWSTVWAAVVDQQDNVCFSAGARFKVPDAVAEQIRQKVEMGHAVAYLIGEKNINLIKQQEGLIGILTNGFVDRTEEYQGIIKLALGIWYGRESAQQLFKVKK